MKIDNTNIELFNEDCMKVMARYEDNYFDLAVVDPPYGIDFANEKERKPTTTRSAQFKFKCKEWDSATPDENYFKELFRVSKNQIIWGGNYFIEYLKNTNCVIIWDKKNPEGMRFSDGEMAWCSFETSLRIFRSLRTYMIEKQQHPTQKPVKLYDWIYHNYAEEGQKILDTHGGSFSNAISAHYAKMSEFVGCELDEDYYESACDRVYKLTRQMELF